MVNNAGEVIGVNTATGDVPDTATPNGYGYAIPINSARRVIGDLPSAG